MPRHPDIGWEHGTMIGGQRNHLECNYCHRTMIGGITRFKKHLAGKSGEIKGCEAAPKEVREAMKKHLGKLPMKAVQKQRRPSTIVPPSTSQNLESDADAHMMNVKRRVLSICEGESHSTKSAEKQISTWELSDTLASSLGKDDQVLAPPRATDIGWAHGTMVNGDRQKIKCRYCSKVILGGGISRLKQHLAAERGNISPCEEVPDNVRSQMKQHLGFKVLENLKKHKKSDNRSRIQHLSEEDYDENVPNAPLTRGRFAKRRKVGGGTLHKQRTGKLLVPHVSPIAQSTSRSAFSSQDCIDQADLAVAKFMYDAGISLNAANSCYFQTMADAIAAVGPGYKMPSYHSLRGELLDKCFHEVGEVCKEIRKSWEITGCTVMVDRRRVLTVQIVINFFVYCPKGMMLLKSIDASAIDNNCEGLLSEFDNIVQEVGPYNIVNFMTDTTPSYRAAGKELMGRYRTFFWSTCLNHGIELILKDLSELAEVKEVFAKGKRICQFIYNSSWLLNLMKKETEGRDIFQPATTEFVTKFLTLDSMVSLKDSLHRMFTGTLWEESTFSKQRNGKDVSEIVLNSKFWLSCTRVLKVSKPLVTVLHLVDSEDRPSMGYPHDAMEKARKGIMSAFHNVESEYSHYLEIIDCARDGLHSPLHAAAYYLNPSIYYSGSFFMNSRIQKGLLDCIETLEPNLTAQDNITRHKVFYEEAMGDFSRPVACRGRETLPPATWWSMYASDYPDLQRFAIRILSQTCSMTISERNWTVNECLHPINMNRLEQERLKGLTFVHYNLRLQQKQLSASERGMAGTRSEQDLMSLEGRNMTVGEWIEDPGAVEGEDTCWMGVAVYSDGDDNSSGTETSGKSCDTRDS